MSIDVALAAWHHEQREASDIVPHKDLASQTTVATANSAFNARAEAAAAKLELHGGSGGGGANGAAAATVHRDASWLGLYIDLYDDPDGEQRARCDGGGGDDDEPLDPTCVAQRFFVTAQRFFVTAPPCTVRP